MKKIVQNNTSCVLILATCVFLIASCANEEDNPLADDRDKFEGTWTCKETPTSVNPNPFIVTINKHGSNDTVHAYNFNNLGSTFKAVFLISGTSIAVPTQDVSGFTVTNGSGTYSGNKINLSYTVDGENFTAVCTQ